MKNRIREDLSGKGYSVGSWLALGSPMVAEVMSSIGYRWLCIDAEHCPLGLTDIAHMARAIESRGAVPIVRVPDIEPSTIARVLDIGVYGIVAPHIQTVSQAQQLTKACYYPPSGTRSTGTGRATTVSKNYYQTCNNELLVIAQIEERCGVENITDIMQVEGVDIGFLGLKDLAIDMDVSPGSDEHEQAIACVLNACKNANKPAGIPIATGAEFQKKYEQGFTFFSLSNDFRLLESNAIAQLKEATPQ